MTPRKVVIAHRGASGYLPEHTREAKALAYGQGADFLEQDVVATRDGALVVLHDIYLDDVTDVALRFPERRRPDGHHYVIDFDLEELRQLAVHERRRRGSDELLFPGRFLDPSIAFRVVTLDEEIRLIRELNRATGKTVGIYPEIKRPDWHRQHGVDLSARLLTALESHGYRNAADPAFVQCFDAAELERCRRDLDTRLRLVQLVEGDETGDAMLTRGGLERIAAYADVVAPSYLQVGAPGEDGSLRAQPWVEDVSQAGLELHTYTLRRERLPPGVRDFESLLTFFLTVADGVFCDQPDVAVAVRDRLLHAAGAGASRRT
jgi:glycerophosphoryl diester phosphodiesterase